MKATHEQKAGAPRTTHRQKAGAPKTTEEKITGAFLSLYEEKPLEKISVKALAEKAGINRGTFYDHYLDIYDLYDRTLAAFTEDVIDIVKKLVGTFLSGDLSVVLESYPTFYESHKQMLQIFFVIRPSVRLQKALQQQVKSSICENFGFAFDDMPVEGRYIMEYITGGQLNLMTHWFVGQYPMDIESLVRLIWQINNSGPWPALLKILKENQA